MKLKNFFVSTFFAMLLMVGTAPLMVGCDEKDTQGENTDNHNNNNNNTDNPDTPSGNYVQYNGQSYTASSLVSVEDEGMYSLSLLFGNGEHTLTFASTAPFGDGSYTVSDSYMVLVTGGVMGMISVSVEPTYVSGTLTISHTGEVYTVDFQGDAVNAHYQGAMVDLNEETGTGTLTYGELSMDLNRGAMYSDTEEGITYQAISLAGENGDITFATLNAFTSGTYSLINASDITMLQPNTAACEVTLYDPTTSENIEATVTSGSLQININDGTYTIHASGSTETETAFQVDYTGTLSVIAFKNKIRR
ncbi:MAG: hypothetical protein K6D59_10635 [Bacteroidales bacterium]|nr:hypothetical protein [Bacteroidales bacterium]